MAARQMQKQPGEEMGNLEGSWFGSDIGTGFAVKYCLHIKADRDEIKSGKWAWNVVEAVDCYGSDCLRIDYPPHDIGDSRGVVDELLHFRISLRAPF